VTATARTSESRNRRISDRLKKVKGKAAILAALGFIFLSGLFSMDSGDWMITVLRGLSVGAITFLVASGLSLIFGLMDVLNLAHGELFMLGAYVGWTVYVRPDTFMDVLLPVGIVVAVFAAAPFFAWLASRVPLSGGFNRILAWALVLVGLLGTAAALPRFPLSMWNLDAFAETPVANSLAFDTGTQVLPPHAVFDGSAVALIILLLITVSLIAFGIALLKKTGAAPSRLSGRSMAPAVTALVIALGSLMFNDMLTEWMYGIGTTYRFFIALGVAAIGGFGLGSVIEMILIRPLYDRPLYQLMITLGLGFIIIETVRSVWGRPEFTMPKPALFAGTGDGCPGEGLSGFFSGCSTVKILDTRIRVYNEFFIILVGAAVLVIITLLIKRTRMGMIIRAGVQDREMVEALGVNVRRVFTTVFGLGVGLAAFGGVIAAPALGLSTEMGSRVLLLALIAMAVGGLTSFPGAAAGAILVGLLQQFVIKLGSTGIPLPWLDEPFKPSPSLVPVSVIVLMIVVLLVAPQGLFGREE